MYILKLAESNPTRVRSGIPSLFKISASATMAVNMVLKPYFNVGCKFAALLMLSLCFKILCLLNFVCMHGDVLGFVKTHYRVMCFISHYVFCL